MLIRGTAVLANSLAHIRRGRLTANRLSTIDKTNRTCRRRPYPQPYTRFMANPFMARAIALAIENVRSGRGGPFGAVVVKDGKIIAEGANDVTSTNDPTAHAEIIAIRKACAALKDFELRG